MPKPFLMILLISKKCFNLFDSVPSQPQIFQFCGITKDILQRSTGSLGPHVLGIVAKFSDLIIGYSLLPVGNRVS